MSFDSLLRHEVVIWRRLGDPSDLDERGQPITTPTATDVWRCRITPLSEREVALLSQSGAVVADHRVFGRPVELSTSDFLVPDPDDGRRFEVMTIRDAAGHGHHIEVTARLVTSTEVAPT